VEGLIDKEAAAGVPSDKVVVAGFSQGGAVALLMLRSDKKLAGIVGKLCTAILLHFSSCLYLWHY
jgi:predicted esterase